MSRSQPEFRLACVVADYLFWCVPHFPVTHVPMGENRDAVTGARIKRMGGRRGWPDYNGPVPPSGQFLALELKAPGGKQSPEQKACQKAIEAAGGRYEIITSLDGLKAVLADMGVPTRERRFA